MKNLYKIEDELYIVSNTENISENCWIITSDRLVQVSYLLSDEVAKGFKVILTTDYLLIKDGVQAIPNDFLEWFLENSSCEFIKVESKDFFYNKKYWFTKYKIIIPKEETNSYKKLVEYFKTTPQEKVLEDWNKSAEYDKIGPTVEEFLGSKQETLEEICNKINFVNPRERVAYYNGLKKGAKWQAKRSYSEEEVFNLCREFAIFVQHKRPSYKKQQEWFEQFKKK